MKEFHIFTAEWCGPCKQMKEDDRWDEFVSKSGVQVHDVEDNQEVANEYQVRSIPGLRVETETGIVRQETGPRKIIEALEDEL